MIRPDALASERPHGPWNCRGRDIWDTITAAASGDVTALRRALARHPDLYRSAYWYSQPIHFAVREGHVEAVRALLDAGADPEARDAAGDDLVTVARDRGHDAVALILEEARALGARATPAEPPAAPPIHLAAAAGDRALVESLLAQGADPNAEIDSAGSATFAARTPELRALLVAHGGTLNAYDLVWLGEDDEAVRRVAADPRAADAGCGGVFAAACKLGKRDLVVRLLDAGARVPPVASGCRSYLMSDPGLLRLLLAAGMNPGMPDWQHGTPLHDLCARDGRGRPLQHRVECATILLEAGASISARDEEYRSTPLAWAARSDLPDMLELLLERGAPTNLPGDPVWATPLAWAIRRGHAAIAERLRASGATA